MATGFTDFNADTYELGNIAGQDGWTRDVYAFNGPFPTEIVALEGSLSGQVLGLWNDGTIVSWGQLTWQAMDPFADGDVVALVRSSTGDEDETIGVQGRGAGITDPPTMVIADIQESATNELLLQHHSASDNPTFVASANFNHDAGDRVWVRLNFNGTALKARAWAFGEAEPGTWGIEETVAGATTSAGYPGVNSRYDGRTNAGAPVYVEAIGWSDDPAVPAPLTATPESSDSQFTRGRTRMERGFAAWG